jgi:iron complex outermembrane recepter protein
MKIATYLLATASLICCVQPAAAQSEAGAAGDAQQATSANTDSATGTAASGDADVGLQEIIVTATKRSQSLQKAPAAITAIGGEALASRGIVDISAASTLVPSARFNIQNNAVQLFIRGAGSAVDTSHIPPSVAMQFNGIYVPRLATRAAFLDVDRIEVLPGPQGTLYGQGAIGGVVNVNTKRPTSEFGSDVSIEGGNYETAHVTAALNVPLSETTSVRGAVDYNHHDSYNSNDTDDQNSIGTRLSLLSKPNDNLTVYLWGGYYQNKYHASPTFYLPLGKNPRDHVSLTDPLQSFFYPPNGSSNRNPNTTSEVYQLGGQIDLNAGGVTVTYIPGFTKYTSQTYNTISGFPLNWRETGKMFSNELRLSNTDSGKLNWLLGFYQFHTHDIHNETFGLPLGATSPILAGYFLPSKQNTLAGFGQLTYSVVDGIRLTAGGRYSWQNLKGLDGRAIHSEFPAFTAIYTPFSYHNSWKRFDWKIGAEADIAPRSMVYANVQTGFNPGTFRSDYPFEGTPIKPQKMLGFTLGSKNQLADNKLQANVEMFYYRYRNQIVQAQQLNFSLLSNAPRSRMYGVQFDGAYSVASDTQLRLTAAYLKAEITRFDNGTVNLAGFELPFSPEWTISGGIDHSFHFNSGAELKFVANTSYNSGYWLSFQHPVDLHQKSFTKTDMSLTYYFPEKNVDIGLWVRNLEDKDVIAAAAATGMPPPYSGAAFLDAPRTYGVRVHYNF